MKVLVVDDFAKMRKIVKGVLKQINLTDVIEAENGKSALTALQKEDIKLIISDWIMPEMSGIEFLKACKEDEALPRQTRKAFMKRSNGVLITTSSNHLPLKNYRTPYRKLRQE